MKRIVGAVVVVIVLGAIALLWRPWERQRTAQLPPPAVQQPAPTTPLVSIDEMQSRMTCCGHLAAASSNGRDSDGELNRESPT